MFISFDDGGSWEQFQLNLPRTPITDIKIHRNDLVVSTMGRAFWIMDNITPLRQSGDAVEAGSAAGGPYLLEPLDVYRIRGGGLGGGSPDEPQYSRRGAELDYMLDVDANSVRIEIMNDVGSVIRNFEGPGGGSAAPTLRRGLNRFVWDLTVPGPNGVTRGGPTVVPGTYMARLTVDGRQQTRSFEILMDPRVAADGVTVSNLQEQFDLGIEIRTAIEDADATIERLEGAMRRVSEGSDVERQLKEIEAALVTDESISSYPQPMLRDQLNYLSGSSQRADQKPGEDMYERLEVLVSELEAHKIRLQRLMRLVI
jgi:hypothetical protein